MPYKKFENYSQGFPQIGDYVICQEEDLGDGNAASKEVQKFINNSIGKIIEVSDEPKLIYPYNVQYQNIPENIEDAFYSGSSSRKYSRKEIIFFSQNKKDCEIYLQMKKYNL